MKASLTITFILFLTANCYSQQPDRENAPQDHNLYISGGLHAAILGLGGQGELPYHIHADKLFRRKFVIGAGYSHDVFQNPMFFPGSSSLRENFRLRYYKYLKDPEESFSTYVGLSAGLSYWKVTYYSEPEYASRFTMPSAQFIFGMKVKLRELLFWQTEFSVGAPYFCQTSIGMKF